MKEMGEIWVYCGKLDGECCTIKCPIMQASSGMILDD
jgi:hypothetical protein